MKQKVKVYSAFAGREVEYDAEVMISDEFDAICNNEDTPDFVVVDGKILYNEETCHAGYAGTCNCISHYRKSWREYTADGWGKLYYATR